MRFLTLLQPILFIALSAALPATHNHDVVLAKNPKINQTPSFRIDQLYNLTTNFLDQYMYPNNVAQTASINSTIFSEDVLGRVAQTRTFAGRELNTEYVFGLFADLSPKQFTLLGLPMSYEIVHFAGHQNIVSYAAIIEYYLAPFNLTSPVEVDIWMTFNSLKQISQYDITFRWLQWEQDSLLTLATSLLDFPNTTATVSYVSNLIANSVCNTAQTYCNGTNQQYDSTTDCMTFMATRPLGESYQLGFDTLQCRMMHQTMVPFRPDVHCPHIGPTGGGYCTNDRTYEGTVLQPFFTNSAFVPKKFVSSNATIAAM